MLTRSHKTYRQKRDRLDLLLEILKVCSSSSPVLFTHIMQPVGLTTPQARKHIEFLYLRGYLEKVMIPSNGNNLPYGYRTTQDGIAFLARILRW